MITRRRHTTSESGCEEDISGKTASILPSSQTAVYNFNSSYSTHLQPSSLLSWNAPNSQVADALYKKTDQPNTSLIHHNGNHATPYSSYVGNNLSKSEFYITETQKIVNSSTDINDPNFCALFNNNVKETVNMASRERTQEFMRIIRSQQGNVANGTVGHKDNKSSSDFRQYGEFMHRAKLIGRNISSTFAKLEKLTHLAKKRSLFDDSHDQEIQELTGIVRHDLTSLTKQLEDLQNRSRLTGSSLNGSTGHLQKHSANLVGSLQTKVASITQKFKDVLEVRTETLKKQAERREQYAGGLVSGELPPQAVSGHQGSVLLADEAAAVATRNKVSKSGDISIDIGMDSSVNRKTLENSSGGTLYQQQLQLMEEQDAYLQSRADTMKTIESTIVELGQMFTQLATMVKEQEEIVHRIDSNVEEAEMNVEAAHTELLKYFKSVSSNRWLMFKIFGVLIVFFVIFVVFMA